MYIYRKISGGGESKFIFVGKIFTLIDSFYKCVLQNFRLYEIIEVLLELYAYSGNFGKCLRF